MMKTPAAIPILAVTALLLCAGCESPQGVLDLGEATSLNSAKLSVQMEKFAQTQQTLAGLRIADIVRLKQANAQAANDEERQLAVMKLSRLASQVTFVSNITAIAQSYAVNQYAGGQTAAMRNAIRLKLTAVDTPATALRAVSKDLDKLSQKEDIKQQAADLFQFAQAVNESVDTLEAAKTNATAKVAASVKSTK